MTFRIALYVQSHFEVHTCTWVVALVELKCTKIIIVIASKVSLRFSGAVNELMLSIYI